VRWHGRSGKRRHPRDMGAPDQALIAVLFLYREVWGIKLSWFE
jgi:hypothetical protein